MLSWFWKRFIGCFVAGVLALLPIVITVAVVIWVGSFLSRYVGPDTPFGNVLAKIGLSIGSDSTLSYALGWVVVLGAVFTTGLLVELGAKRAFNGIADGVLKRVPLIGSIYSTTKQVVDMLDKKDEQALKSMTAVYCFFGEESPTGLLAFLVSPEVFHVNGKDFHIVIIPTAPVPFGGAMIFVPAESVIPANMPIDALMSIYVSMGATAPQYLQTKASADPT